ncbi:hypothetical protein CCHR01_14959 [Colletotrichum chrysophilum]|uniref:Uncharacterized protein n=1 Tax=Colletotrichum chrysophilum TaxID=1836956 RepID=A0AAD9EBU0_9PEZI|nr:hypothetical protein CCHR01_14959 [Colletotrichum chrysophilum]
MGCQFGLLVQPFVGPTFSPAPGTRAHNSKAVRSEPRLPAWGPGAHELISGTDTVHVNLLTK